MFVRWIILKFCRTQGDLRVVLRTVRRYVESHNDGIKRGISKDRRVNRSWRLSIAFAFLIVYAERPQLFALALLSVPVIAVLLCIRLITYVSSSW